MQITFYGCAKCGTSRKAEQWFKARDIEYNFVDITENPPSLAILKEALAAREGKIGKLFNTSGDQYKTLKIKDKLPTMTTANALKLLASNGRLIRRPLVVRGHRVTVGFDEAEFAKVWGATYQK